MANSNGWGDGAANNSIGWGQGANNNIGWGDSHAKSWAGATDIVGIDSASSAYFTATGITGATQQTAIDNLVKGLKADGLWSKMKAVYPFVTDNRNLLSYTEDFSNAYWSKSNVNVTANAAIAPNGTLTADSFNDGAANDYHVAQVQLGTLTANATFTASTSLKYIDRRYAYIAFYLNQSPYPSINVTVDLLNKSIVSSVGASASIILQDNNWFRVSVTGIVGNYSTNLWYQVALLDDSLNPSYLGSGKSMYVWGAQLETGALTTYQPIATTQQAFISSQFKYNLVNPVDSDAAFRLVFNGGWTHSSNGATPNGTNGYADTKLNENTTLALNNIHLSHYSRTNNTLSVCDIGLLDTSVTIGTHTITHSSGNAAVRNTDISTGFTATASTAAMFINTRSSSTQTKYFYNNSLFSTIVSASVQKSNLTYFLGARNNSNAAALFSNRQLAFSTIGDGLTDTEAANLYTRVQAFQNSLNRAVI